MKLKFVTILLLIIGFLIACNGYKTPTPPPPTAAVDGITKFYTDKNNLFVTTKTGINQYTVATNGTSVVLKEAIKIPYFVESIIYQKDTLFLSSQDGLHLYDIKTKADVKLITGIKPCNKVILKDTLLYILKGIQYCVDTATIGLKIYNLKDLKKIKFVAYYPLKTPTDMVIVGKNLFIANDKLGIFSYDLTNPRRPNFTGNASNRQAITIVAKDNTLWVKDSANISQYVFGTDGSFNFKTSIPFK